MARYVAVRKPRAAIALVLSAVSLTAAADAQARPSSGFVARSAGKLTLHGQPYRFTGLNVYNANSVNNCWYTLGAGPGLRASLRAMGRRNKAFRAWFFQYEATKHGGRDWSAFDHTLAVARRQGKKVIATLVNQWGQCEGWGSYTDGYKSEAWYQSGYRLLPSSPGMPTTYRQWVAQVVARYKNHPEILAWQLVNEAEDRVSYVGSCSPTAAASLRSFAVDMASLVKSIDRNHLLSLGTTGSGQCGARGGEYKKLHRVRGVDLCEYHDYDLSPLPGDRWNGLRKRISQCRALHKPLFVGELGIKTSSAVAKRRSRATLLARKLSAQFRAGVVGALAWDWRDAAHGGSSGSGYEIGPSDPALRVLGRYGRQRPCLGRAPARLRAREEPRRRRGRRGRCRARRARAASSPRYAGWWRAG